MIDYNKRLSPQEHYLLYRYALLHGQPGVAYQNFELTQSLIDQYNRAPAQEKQQMAAQIQQDPAYLPFLNAFQARPWELEKPVLWSDRKKTPYFIRQLTDSHAFEVYIDWLFRTDGVDIGLYYGKEQQYHMGETEAGIEIKYDKLSEKTGNYYIEYQERLYSNGPWVNSGILKEDRTRFYLLGTMKQFVILKRDWLMDYYRRLVEQNQRLPDARLVCEQTHHTSKGFILLPAAWSKGTISIQTLIKTDLKQLSATPT